MIYIIKGFWNLFLEKLGFISKSKKEIFDKHLNICLSCKYLDDNFCLICGCYVYAKTKINYKLDEHGKAIDGCPRKYW